jgi:dihydroorotate dehydrogenase
MGADLVQVYSALLFRGPFFFRQVAGRAPREALQ